MLKNIHVLLALSLFMSGCGREIKVTRPPPSVSVSEIGQMDVPVYFDSIGIAVPTSTVPVRPQVGGKLLVTYVKEGDDVEEGQLLYTIDPRPFKDALDIAEANLTKNEALLKYAKKTEERYATVVEQDYVSKLSFEQYQTNTLAAAAQVISDKAAVSNAKLNLDFSNVVAPIAGKISNFNIYVGNIVIADDPIALTTIRPFSPIDISFSLPQSQFDLVRQAQGDRGIWNFIAISPEDPKKIYEGKSWFIDNQINQDTGTLLIKGSLPNYTREIWPGMYLRIKVLQKMVPNALTVPPGAILIGRDGPYLYTMDAEHKVTPINVNVITRNEEYIAVTSDQLQPGMQVVYDGQINVAPGMQVNVIKPKDGI